MASEIYSNCDLDTATIIAILVERAGGSLTIPADAVIAMVDRNADVGVHQDVNDNLIFTLEEKNSG